MGYKSLQSPSASVWSLAKQQHGVVSRDQLLALGFSPRSIHHRLAKGRLYRVRRGVYAVGRPQLTRHGQWIAAVLRCGAEAVLSHESAAALWGIRPVRSDWTHVSVPMYVARRAGKIVVHRRAILRPEEMTRRDGIPVTTPVCTLVDIALRLTPDGLEAAVNEADKLDLVDTEQLRAALDEIPTRPGIGALRELLDRHAFVLADSQLERLFFRLVRAAGLPLPKTGQRVNGFKVDFFWPDLGLVVETDGLRYHRTPAEQARDRIRDQTHTAAGLTTLRFTRAQVRYEPRYVQQTLAVVARRLRRA